jgi:long-chain acyl-CoA synthetase
MKRCATARVSLNTGDIKMHKFRIETNMPKNLPLLIKRRVEECGNLYLQASKNEKGEYIYYTYSEVYERIIALAAALKDIGVHRESKVAIISDNRKEWLISDLAIQSLGACDVPRGCDSLGNEIRYIISFADCYYAIFENFRQLEKVLENVNEVPLLKTAILFDRPTGEEAKKAASVIAATDIEVIYYDELMERGKKIYTADSKAVKADIENEMEQTGLEDVATIIFTSGTTGTPKGVMLTQGNYITQLSVIPDFMPCKPGEWWMSILPVWHTFERLIQYVAPFFKCGIAYSKPVASILLADMAAVRPQWICGVPRLWEALANGVNKAMKKKGGITLKLFTFFVGVGKQYANAKDKVLAHVCRIKKRNRFLDFLAGIIPCILLWPLHKLGDLLVFRKIRAKFGGRLGIAISGGGALQKDVDDFYRAVGLNLLEGYGLTETAPVISFRYYKEPRPGCVGAIFPSMEVKILPEEHGVITSQTPLGPGQKGIIFVRSGQVMKGYYKRPDLTEKIIDKDGWLNTGDIGILTWDNELKITGRAKDTIVLLGGENIEPAIIESELCTSEYIESAIVLGQDKKYLASLIVPSKDAVIQYAQENGIDFTDYEQLIQTEAIKKLIFSEVCKKDCTDNGFRICERINKITLVPNSFKVGVELSAKQEMIRHRIAEKYAEQIEAMF